MMSLLTIVREKLEAWMCSVAFAEANEPDKARQLSGFAPAKKGRSVEDFLVALTFAESGEHDIAREYLGVGPEPVQKSLVLPGVKIWYGSVLVPEPVSIGGAKIWCGTVSVG